MNNQGYIQQLNNVNNHKPLKVRPCFIRLLRDKDVDQRTRKKYKKNEAEVNIYNYQKLL